MQSRERVRLVIYSMNGTAFTYLCDRDMALKVYDTFKNNTAQRIELSGTINHIDANEVSAVFDSENISNLELLEIKGF